MLALSAVIAAVVLCPPEATASLAAYVGAGEDVDAHHLAEALDALCPGDPAASAWRLYDAVALTRLEEAPRARALLQAELRGPDPALRERAAALLSWSLWRTGDDEAFRASLARVPPPARLRLEALAAAGDDAFAPAAARLDPLLRARAVSLERQAASRERRPWLAGTLSALVPGLGQAYAGSWQGAAIAFVLNGVLIGATVELTRKELYFAAGATGLAASIFYVGNIANAADLARRRNEVSTEPARDALEQTLVPELR